MKEKIGEVISSSVLGGLVAKLSLNNPEDLRIGYPVVVEGRTYYFYCMVHDIVNQSVDIAERLAGSRMRDSIVPLSDTHEGFSGRIFYSKANLRPIQLIHRGTHKLSEPQTIPPYFSVARHASLRDVEKIYQRSDFSAPLGSIRGVERFMVHIDFSKLTEKPFGIFGRTGMGKSVLNKLVCIGILSREVGSVLIFDMHGEYGVYSRTDKTEGLKYYFPEKVKVFSLDPKNKEAVPFIIDPDEIRPEDIIVAFQDLNRNMVDAIYEINRSRKGDIVSAIRRADLEEWGHRVHPSVLSALKRRMGRMRRFSFVRRGGKDAIKQLISLIRERRSVVLDFGEYGTDQMVYLFVANVLTRRLFDMYTERNEEFPRLVLFLEEAHKFLAPNIASYTIFNKLARETRKFNLILALVDQRPAKIDDEVRSQLANRLILSLKEPSDLASALAGVPDRSVWESIVATIPARTVAMVGDAIRIPTVIDIMNYTPENVRENILDGDNMTSEEMDTVAQRVDKVFSF